MPRKKKVTSAEEFKEWDSLLKQLKTKVEKSHKSDPDKHKYDLLTSLNSAERCIQ